MISAKVSVDVSGFVDLIGITKTRAVTLKGVRAGAKELLSIVRPLAPRRKGGGALRQSQGVKAAKGKRGKTVSFAVQGARTKFEKMSRAGGYTTPQRVVPAFYDHLVQGGTRAHRLGKGESLLREAKGRRKGKQATKQTTGGAHPGTQANPYRKRAYEGAKARIEKVMVDVMVRELNREIERINAKLAKGGK